ncbi:MAG: cytochrome c3 family protein, partial [Burkholderiales bacterium]
MNSGSTPWIVSCPLALIRWLLACLLLQGFAASQALAQNIESVLRPGDLVQAHAKWEEDCSKCHVRFERAAQDRLCADCHKEVGQDMRERTGFHGRQQAQPCRSCHTDHKGRNARIVVFDKARFDHTQTDFVLRGKHGRVECDKCHEPSKKYWQAASDCNACHKRDDVHKGSLGTKCADCHTENDWKEKAKFDHDKTRFALKDKHASAKCADCH